MKLSSSAVTQQIVKIKANQEKSRLCLLMLEFYAYMEKQGFPEFWKNCKGIKYPTHNLDKRDHNLYWWFKWKDGTETKLLADKYNMQFKDLKGFKLKKDENNKGNKNG
jgi:hypothetical protein